VAPGLILEGVIPCAPWKPTVAIRIRVLEAYRVMHVRCPHLAIQAFVKSLCDIHGVAYRPYLCQQFSISYDLYLDLRRRVDERVMKALGRDSSWRMKHACPACTYKLEGEEKLIFDMLTTMDGNDSLKRVLRREKTTMAEDESGEPTVGRSKERVDNRDAGDGYMLSRQKVDKWAKSRLAEVLPMQSGNSDGDNPCADRWKNMVSDVTSKMWGIFDETGVFLALCRHGFVLVLADMIRSGELAKYPLAIVEELLATFGMNLGAGYDVGCHFKATVAHSELGEEAQEKNLKCLVGSFHGHAHNRLCQLSFLATYVEGMGLEDLEGCERFFSRSNGLSRSCRYANRFHRQQEITTYVKHFDSFETYANLSKFLVTNYKQALGILKTESALVRWMKQEGVPSTDEFHHWLEEERAYLVGLKNTPKSNVETMEMEYVQKLVNLSASQCVFLPFWWLTDPDGLYFRAKYNTLAAEARRATGDDGGFTPGVPKAVIAKRHAKEKLDKDLDSVQQLEDLLLIAERWTTASPKWLSTTVEIKKRKYQLALDSLELLIVERIFELTKMNQSQTAKALQARSKAVRAAIDRYNAAAMLLDPPMAALSWDQVVEYAFLADFDILRDTRPDVQARPWTRPSYRLAMDRFFKILRAREEIKRLNVEIPRVITWIRDENRFLREKEAELRDTTGKSDERILTDVQMAVQVRLYRERRGRFDERHMQRFWKLGGTPGFTGSLRPGMSADAEWEDEEMVPPRPLRPEEDSDEEGEGHVAREEAVSGLMYQISMLAVDDAATRSGDEA
ncbi:hypothetical protein C8R43DRAFT_881321, partial [Mycena crocata]